MNISYHQERRLLQAAIIIACSVPLCAGLAGMIIGPAFILDTSDAHLNNHFRYLSGLLFAIGVAFITAVPSIEHQKERVRLLTFLVVIGGVARLTGMIFADTPSISSFFALGMELIITPCLCLWQSRIESISRLVHPTNI